MGGAGPWWWWRPPGYMGAVWELGGMGPVGEEVDGMKLVGGTPGLPMVNMPPGVDVGGDSGGPDRLAACIEGPGGGKTEGPPNAMR